MKKVFALVLAICVVFTAPLIAQADGAGIFNANCVACHAAGGNTVNPGRTLQQEDLKSFLANYTTDGEAAIVAQVTNGKSPMPSFNGVLTSSEISEVASYVESMSLKGWG